MLDILLSTFNGREFIDEQLTSILEQDGADFRLLVRDDGSTDGTVEIVARRAAADARIKLVSDGPDGLGPAASFLKLLEVSDADHFMLADQDDVWLPGKIASAVKEIVRMSGNYGDETPLLVFTDLSVCDRKLNIVARSFWEYQRLDPLVARDWKRLLAQNVVTGCTMIGNAAARRVSLPFALPAMMHDHWIAVNVARTGHVNFIPEPSVLYRQHGENSEGAKDFGFGYAAVRTLAFPARYRFYRAAARHFGCSSFGLMYRKVRENLSRLFNFRISG